MYTHACRITETLEMRFGHEIDLKNKRYVWSDGQNKADLDGWHSLHPSLIGPLHVAYEERVSERLFPQLHDTGKALKSQQIDWQSWRDRAGLDFDWTPHTFRHTCLSNLFNDPANPQALICKLYRVSLATAMESYVHPTESGREILAKAIKVEL
jgi:integrase